MNGATVLKTVLYWNTRMDMTIAVMGKGKRAMTIKKPTDEEIIKALQCCSEPCAECDECPLYCIGANCSSFELHRYALDLVNRQKAEIERLNSVNDEKFRQWDMLTEKTKQHYADLYEEARDILKVEAYKEFAERLKEKSFKTIRNYGLTKDVVEVCDIDNLVKEMVGAKNDR